LVASTLEARGELSYEQERILKWTATTMYAAGKYILSTSYGTPIETMEHTGADTVPSTTYISLLRSNVFIRPYP
jgi:hypothetical protein